MEEPLHSSSIDEECEQNPFRRRFWLLRQALKSGSSMAEALKIAQEIEAFLVVGAASRSSKETASKVAAASLETVHGKPRAMPQAALSLLEPEKKAAISARLEAGDANAQLAAEFGLTPRQVQGFRMQMARRAKSKTAAEKRPRQTAGSASVPLTNPFLTDEVVRYLRQQDDIVVADGPGMFLVNGRFRMDFEQLQHRAKRMRQRQRQPEFPHC